MKQDRLQNAVDVLDNLIVVKPDDAIAAVKKRRSASLVMPPFGITRMRPAVDLDDQLFFPATEISEARADRLLADEFEAGQLSIVEPIPKQFLGMRRGFSQRAGARGLSAWHFVLRHPPHRTSPRFRGEEATTPCFVFNRFRQAQATPGTRAACASSPRFRGEEATTSRLVLSRFCQAQTTLGWRAVSASSPHSMGRGKVRGGSITAISSRP
jgi:hypothetical protein